MFSKSAIPKWLSRVMAVAMMGALLNLGSVASAGASPQAPADVDSCWSPTPNSFSDVPANYWAGTAISWLVEAGITQGVTPTEFQPNGIVNRAQMAVFLWRAAGEPAAVTQQTFTDVPADYWANDAISWLVEAGITQGVTPTEFQPNGIVTRGQMATFLWRANAEPAPGQPHSFTDVTPTSYYNTAVSWAVDVGVTQGTSPGLFSPNGKVTRGQMATFLWRDGCGPVQPTQFASAASGEIQINVLVPGDPDATPPTPDETIPVNIPITGQAQGGWAQAANGPFSVDLTIDNGSFPLEVPGIGTLTVSYSIPEVASGGGLFDPQTGLGGFDMDLVITVDEVSLLGPIAPPCDLEFGMSLDGQIDPGTGMLGVDQEGFAVTPPQATDCGGLGGIFGDLLGGPDNSVELQFMVGQF